MPNQLSMIKDNQVVNDEWTLVTDDESTIVDNSIVPLSLWEAQTDLQNRSDIGVWITNDVELNAIGNDITKAPLIAIEFPVFMDGRGFSLARLLRERYNYQGEIRAIGHIIRDQLCYLKRCGFNAFTFTDDSGVDVNEALNSLNDFTEAYQTSVDKPQPLFRRRA